MRRYTLSIIAIVFCLTALAIGEGEDQMTICHNGREITVAEPAVLQAHLDHGDCLGVCFDCLGRCCLGVDGFVFATEVECAELAGRFNWSKDEPCFTIGD